MSETIVKTIDKRRGNLVQRYVFGLNIFPNDHARYWSLDDPRLDFLRGICSNNRSSAVTGSLYDFANTPKELFGKSNYRNGYETVRIGCYGGDFYDSDAWDLFRPLFFHRISPDFFDIERDPEQSEDISLLADILYSDAIALFIAPKSDDSETELWNLLNQPLASKSGHSEANALNFLKQPQTSFLERAANLYEIVLTTQADGDYFECYSQSAGSFALMDGSLNTVAKSIEESDWYKENKAELIWDEEYSGCLVLNSTQTP